MSVYHQMGHHSNNLVDLPELSAYAGAILSPINATLGDVQDQVDQVHARAGGFEFVFDPQLYIPAAQRGKLKKWAYFPKDVDTGDIASREWWKRLNKAILADAKAIPAGAVCSPVVIPRVFDNTFYSHAIDVATDFALACQKHSIQVLQTALVSTADLVAPGRPLEIASIFATKEVDRVYLVFEGIKEPRRELTDVDELVGAMQLVNAFERNGIGVLVGFCSSDLILWKAARASACASGKFFNLRRFTRERFEEPSDSGGGTLPYWFEEGLLAFLRQGDLVRLRKRIPQLISPASSSNPFCTEILAQLEAAERTPSRKMKPWLGLSWRQFLFWFGDVESRLSTGKSKAADLLKAADDNWKALDSAKVFPEERGNDGTWIRDWMNALHEFEESIQQD